MNVDFADPLDLAVEMRTGAQALLEHAQRMLDCSRRLEDQHRTRRMEQVARALLHDRTPRPEVCRVLVARFGICRQHGYKVIDRALAQGPR